MPYPIYMTGQNLNSLVLACGHNANSLGWRDLLLLQNFNWLSPHLKKKKWAHSTWLGYKGFLPCIRKERLT